jgi:hypothetical protein
MDDQNLGDVERKKYFDKNWNEQNPQYQNYRRPLVGPVLIGLGSLCCIIFILAAVFFLVMYRLFF